MYTLNITKKVKIDRNRCDHIWVEEVFITKLFAVLKILATIHDGEQWKLCAGSNNVVRTIK